MTIYAFILILISVFLHAGWNFLSKKSCPSFAFFLIAATVGALFSMATALASGVSWALLPTKFWLFFGVAIFFEDLYTLGLSYGYKVGDFSLVYPTGRALPVILTAIVTIFFGIGKLPACGALIGMAVIFAGCIMMPLTRFRDFSLKVYCSRIILFILLMATGTTGYTIFDSMAMGELKCVAARTDIWRSLFYIFCVEAGIALTMIPVVLAMPKERKNFREMVFRDYRPYLAGVFTTSAYALVLLAMCYVTNVSFVQAFRQMSIPIGVLLGIVFLKERCSPTKVIGTILIVTGLVVVAYCR